MTYGSVCSGIEAATVAWKPLGWRCAWTSEIEPFPSAVLRHHYPETTHYGDFTKIKDPEPIDLLVGGTPCQAFSVAGLRGGLDDARGNLTLEFLRLAGRLKPRWIVWENVPGVLSIDGGRTFGTFLGGLAALGYGFSYRVLDAQYFGLANDASVCSLSDILETGDVPQRYFLTAKACAGILRRAEKRGKELPEALKSALVAVASLT